MRKLIICLLAIILCLLPVFCFAQIWEGSGGNGIDEGIGFGGGISPTPPTPPGPTPVDPNAVYTFYMAEQNASITYGADAEGMTPVHYDSESGLIVDGDWTSLINEIFTPVMLKSDGTVDYELSRDDYRYRSDGVTLSDASNVNYDGNAMVRIKKFYVKVGSAGNVGTGFNDYNASFSISLVKADSDFEALGFVNADGTECDYAYMSMFEGYVDSNDKLRSIAGVAPTLGTTTNTHNYFVARATANGNGWNIESRALKTALDYLHILLFKNIRPVSQTGYGYRDTNGTVSLTTGQSYGKYNTYLATMPKTANNGRSKTFWIENFLDGDFRWLNGFYYPNNSNVLYTKNSEPYDITDLTDWTSWETSSSIVTGKVRTVNSANSSIAYMPIFKDNTILFNDILNQAQVPSYYIHLVKWGNIDQYLMSSTELYGMTGQSDYFAQSTAPNDEIYFNSILTILSLGTNLGYGKWHNNCCGRLIYLSQPSSLANVYSVSNLSNLSTLSLQRNDLQIQSIEEEQLNVISTDTMEVDK